MEEKVQTFRKKGGGSFRFKGKIVKQNQTFEAYPSEIPENFRDIIVPVGSKWDNFDPQSEPDAATVQVKEAEYYKKHKGGGRWQIYRKVDDGEDKLMSGEKTYLKDEADQVISDLKG